MTRHELDKILETSFWKRNEKGLQTFEWEHCAKVFCYITNDSAIKHLMKINDSNEKKEGSMILKCKSNSGVYYFGVGLKDCDNIGLRKLKELYKYGNWYVYTWSD